MERVASRDVERLGSESGVPRRSGGTGALGRLKVLRAMRPRAAGMRGSLGVSGGLGIHMPSGLISA